MPAAPRVAIIMGSDSDWPVLKTAAETLKKFSVGYEVRILSAHRSPEAAADFARTAADRGLQVLIAAAGMAAHLAGALSAHTTLPVIGIPMAAGTLQGVDALLATVQMPPGIPVATVGIGAAANAAILAIQILSLSDPVLAAKLKIYKTELADSVNQKNQKLQKELA